VTIETKSRSRDVSILNPQEMGHLVATKFRPVACEALRRVAVVKTGWWLNIYVSGLSFQPVRNARLRHLSDCRNRTI
jgi:hypothetical protein